MRSPRPLLLVLASSVSLGGAAGCSGDSGVDPVGEAKPAKASPQARRQLKDPRSPASMTVEFWQSVQRGALPLSLERYDRRVINAIGIANFAGMLSTQQPQIQKSRLNVLRVDEVAGGRLVSAEALPERGPKVQHSFFLRRRDGRWMILYDTLSAAGLEAYVQARGQRTIDPNTKAAATRITRAAAQAIDAYREAGLSLERRSRPGKAASAPPAARPTPPAAAPNAGDADTSP